MKYRNTGLTDLVIAGRTVPPGADLPAKAVPAETLAMWLAAANVTAVTQKRKDPEKKKEL